MKYSELDFNDGKITWDSYKNYPEESHFKKHMLDQDMLCIQYKDYTIDLGWYQTVYLIAIIDNNSLEWNPFYSIKVLNHDEVFDKLQEVINNAESLFNLKVFL